MYDSEIARLTRIKNSNLRLASSKRAEQKKKISSELPDSRDPLHLALQGMIGAMLQFVSHKPTCISRCNLNDECSCGATNLIEEALIHRWARNYTAVEEGKR